MANNNESTTKFKVDISELKSQMQEAARSVRLANSEFKAATSGMDNWAGTADGLSAKVKQMGTVLSAQNRQLETLQKQYALVAKEQGENSKGAQELLIKINNQKAAISKTEKELQNYQAQLTEIKRESEQTASAADKLKSAISRQETELEDLKRAYSSASLELGNNSTVTKQLGTAISKLSTELQSNRSRLKEAENAANEFDNALDKVDDTAKDAGEGFTIMKGALAQLAADGIRVVVSALGEMATETDRTMNSFKAQTGASAEEVKAFGEEINALYLDGFGENLQDVADKMAKVKQATGEVDPGNIKDLTEQAILFSETFDTDFNESLRGADALMKNMGLSAAEAFDYMAKGAQRGLNKTDELGDNIAEYSQLWDQAGFAAGDMFKILENGLNSGAYNLDKVNDFVKEFTISLADGRIEENISAFSDNTAELFNQWKNGEKTAKDVFESVISDLNNAENEQTALTTASTVWSALGEDNAMKVIRSLNDANDAYEEVGGTMEEIKKIKYDDIENEWKKLGRTAKQELLAPILKEILPGVKNFINYCIKNFDKLIPVIKSVGAVLVTAFAAKKIYDFITAIKTLGVAVAANPVGALVTAVGLLTVGIIQYSAAQQDAIEKQYGLTEAQKETIEETNNLYDAYKKTDEVRKTSNENINAEYGYLTQLKEELNNLVNANGEVKEGYEDRANFIVNQLADALGIEKDKIWEIIETNGKLGESIDEIIRKKQAEALLSANEETYKEALQNRSEALKNYQDSMRTLTETENKYRKAQEESKDVFSKYSKLMSESPAKAYIYYLANKKVIEGTKTARRAYEDAQRALQDSEAVYVGYNATIKNYEGLSSAILSGEADKIRLAMDNVTNSFISAENGTKESLKRQVVNLQDNYNSLKEAIKKGTPGVTQEMVDSAKNMVDCAVAEMDKFNEQAKNSGNNGGKGFVNGLFNTKIEAKTAAAEIAAETNTALSDADTYTTGNNFTYGFINGLKNGNILDTLWNAAHSVGKTALKALSTSIQEGSPSKLTERSGKFFGMGFVNGIADQAKNVVDQAKKIGMQAVEALGDSMDQNSVTLDIDMGKGKLYKNIAASSQDGKAGSATPLNNPAGNISNVYYTQYNTSPKALSRLEIYRQTKNQLALLKN